MAEKEERIAIAKMIVNTDYEGSAKLDHFKIYTRKEAIERINHAICVEVHGPCDICEQVRGGNEGHCNDYKQYAESALNALLSEED